MPRQVPNLLHCNNNPNSCQNLELKNEPKIGGLTYGGAIYIESATKLKLVDCDIQNNSATFGGGLYVYYTELEIENT